MPNGSDRPPERPRRSASAAAGGHGPSPLYSGPVTQPSPFGTSPSVGAAQSSGSRRTLGCLFEIVETLVLTVVIFFVIQTFVAQPYQVRQQSMEHTLEPGEYVLVDKLTPRVDTYKRGDVIVFEPPEGWAVDGDRTPFIKRVIGIAGDTIELVDGHVVVNGQRLTEPYLFEQDGTPQPTDPTGGQSRWTITPGELFVMGDHRGASADSRTFGPIPVTSVIGRAWLRYWPISGFGILQTPRYPNLSATPVDLPPTGAAPVGDVPSTVTFAADRSRGLPRAA